METKVEYKPVNAVVTDPADSLFKSNRNDRAECRVVLCSNSENCELFKRKECALLSILGSRRCPYGKQTYEGGFTKKARNYHSWRRERLDKYAGVLRKLGTYGSKIAVVGDYVFLPYAHMNMNKNMPVDDHSSIFNSGSHFVPREKFTVDVIINIMQFRPYALMGGEIKSYQSEVVPMFAKHLSEEMPDVFEKLVEKYPRAAEMLESFTNVKRKAYLRSLRPGVVITKYHDSDKLKTQHWHWDGEYLTSTDAGVSFPPVDFQECDIKLKPKPDVTVEITDDNQVDENTEFET